MKPPAHPGEDRQEPFLVVLHEPSGASQAAALTVPSIDLASTKGQTGYCQAPVRTTVK